MKKVLIVDDSAVIRQVLAEVLGQDPDLRVIGTASDPIFAMKRMEQEWPDVIVLDIEMPRMDGLTFLRQIMAERPTPVVMCSTLTEQGAEATMQAFSAGAVDIVTKPKIGLKSFLHEEAAHLVRTVKAAADARLRRAPGAGAGKVATPAGEKAVRPVTPGAAPVPAGAQHVIALGASTGGTQALEAVLTRLPASTPGIVIVQHMPEKFTAAFAGRLNTISALEVLEARDGDEVRPGRALLAPGGRHMRLKRYSRGYTVEVFDGPPVRRHKPSVDVLFGSVARVAGPQATGVLMTGMGDDGAQGLLEMRQAGAVTFAESEETCVVFGMPREAIRRDAACHVVPLYDIPAALQQARR
ncbi:MAG: protein-glutamate methylesterase/protein-glutamine glutaminase [Pseudomonadota bacterium]